MKVAEVMVPALHVAPSCPVLELAELLLESRADGACVVDEGMLVGVVTSMDLVFQQKEVHLPPVLTFMDFAIPLESPVRLRAEFDKIAGTTVADIMSRDAITTTRDVVLSEVATLMVERHLTIVPVLTGTKLEGVVTKHSLLSGIFKPAAAKA